MHPLDLYFLYEHPQNLLSRTVNMKTFKNIIWGYTTLTHVWMCNPVDSPPLPPPPPPPRSTTPPSLSLSHTVTHACHTHTVTFAQRWEWRCHSQKAPPPPMDHSFPKVISFSLVKDISHVDLHSRDSYEWHRIYSEINGCREQEAKDHLPPPPPPFSLSLTHTQTCELLHCVRVSHCVVPPLPPTFPCFLLFVCCVCIALFWVIRFRVVFYCYCSCHGSGGGASELFSVLDENTCGLW